MYTLILYALYLREFNTESKSLAALIIRKDLELTLGE
jgi:hypothetical protein